MNNFACQEQSLRRSRQGFVGLRERVVSVNACPSPTRSAPETQTYSESRPYSRGTLMLKNEARVGGDEEVGMELEFEAGVDARPQTLDVHHLQLAEQRLDPQYTLKAHAE